MNMKTIRYIVSAMLLLAIADLPYGYYTILRVIVTIVAGITAFIAYDPHSSHFFSSSSSLVTLAAPWRMVIRKLQASHFKPQPFLLWY